MITSSNNRQDIDDNMGQNEQQHNNRKQEPIMMRLLNEYNRRVNEQQEIYKQILKQRKQTITKQFTSHLDKYFIQFQQQFTKYKHSFKQQIKTIQYYIENFMQKHSMNPKQNNLYPLFNSIDQKINKNLQYLRDNIKIQFKYPQNKENLYKKRQQLKTNILEKQIIAIRQLLSTNTNFIKYCQPQLKRINQLHQQYDMIYEKAQKNIYTPQLKFTGTYQQCLLMLQINTKIQKISLSIRSYTGKLTLSQYQSILNQLSSSSINILTQFNLKFMDMEFQQLKCNQIKKFIKSCKFIKKVKIQNYYQQNKLGIFEQFNWLPLKKQTHVIGKVW